MEERLQQERLRRERGQVQAAEERRRRKLWMGLAASVLAAGFLLAGGLVVVNHLRGQERAAKEQAQQREQETRAVMDELSSTGIEDWLARQPELTPQQKAFLRKGLAYYEDFTRQTGETPEGRAALARAYRRVGNIRRQLGGLLPEAEEALQQAVGLSAALAREFPGEASYQRDAAEAVLALAIILGERGQHRKAVPLLDEAIRRQEAVQRDLGGAPGKASLAKLHLRHATLRAELRQWDEAETSFRAALTMLTELDDVFADDPDHRRHLADVHHNRAKMLLDQEHFDEAEKGFGRAIAILQKLADALPSVRIYKHRLAQSQTARGVALWKLGKHDDAGDAYREALPILQTLVADFRSQSVYRQELANVFNNLALALEDQGQLEDSAAATRQAITLREQLVKENPLVLDYAVSLGGSYGNLGHLLRDQGRPADSLEWYDKAVDTLEPALAREDRHGTTRQYLRNIYSGRAQSLDRLGRPAEAAKDWDRVLVVDDGKRRLFYESRRALSLGDHARAVALASEQAQAKGVNSKTVYDCARVFGLAAVVVKDDPALREQYAGRAAELIRKALDAGYKGPRLDVRKDDALDPLREREEFRQLLLLQEAKARERDPGRK